MVNYQNEFFLIEFLLSLCIITTLQFKNHNIFITLCHKLLVFLLFSYILWRCDSNFSLYSRIADFCLKISLTIYRLIITEIMNANYKLVNKSYDEYTDVEQYVSLNIR